MSPKALINLVRNANGDIIRTRLAEVNAEAAALETLLQSIEARDHARRAAPAISSRSPRKVSGVG